DVYKRQLQFDFPGRAAERYADAIEAVGQQTNWNVMVAPEVNQQALGTVIFELLPEGAQITKGPSFFLSQGVVKVDIEGLDAHQELVTAYKDLTGMALVVNDSGGAAEGPVTAAAASEEQLEINAAYALIREALGAYGLYKTSLKQGQIILSFISPEVGTRHYDTIQALARQTGYPIAIHPHPNQNAILQEARTLISATGAQIVRGPSIYTDRGAVLVKVDTLPDGASQLGKRFEDATGYRLEIQL
ncbi:MAG: hypothetical protein GYB66_02765, partial [Chloroflexi bacterium]|nr:hypothetical protein [Chloroflexota bacterium]